MSAEESLARELQRYKDSYRRLEEENVKLREENRVLKEELASLKTTVSAVVARSIDARADAPRRRYRKSGRREGHQGASRARPAKIDATVVLDQSTCPRCGGLLSEKPTDSYTRVVEDIVPAKVVTTEYVVNRRYCRCCGKQVSPQIPNVVDGGSNERFGLRLMLLIVSLKLLGTSYEKIGSLLKLLFDLDLTEGAMIHCVMAVAKGFGQRYEELKEELVKEKSIHGDETSWRIKGRNHWLWAFLGKWSVVYEVDRSRGKDVPRKVLGGDYRGIVTSDSWGAWNHIGVKWHQALPRALPEGAGGDRQVQEPGRRFLPVPEEAQEDTQGRDKDGRCAEPRREAESQGQIRGEDRQRAHRVVFVIIDEGEELRQAPQAAEEGEQDALHVPRGGRRGLEQ